MFYWGHNYDRLSYFRATLCNLAGLAGNQIKTLGKGGYLALCQKCPVAASHSASLSSTLMPSKKKPAEIKRQWGAFQCATSSPCPPRHDVEASISVARFCAHQTHMWRRYLASSGKAPFGYVDVAAQVFDSLGGGQGLMRSLSKDAMKPPPVFSQRRECMYMTSTTLFHPQDAARSTD